MTPFPERTTSVVLSAIVTTRVIEPRRSGHEQTEVKATRATRRFYGYIQRGSIRGDPNEYWGENDDRSNRILLEREGYQRGRERSVGTNHQRADEGKDVDERASRWLRISFEE
jgi:hypothetical protein